MISPYRNSHTFNLVEEFVVDRTAAGRADIDATGHEKTQVVIVGSGFEPSPRPRPSRSPRRRSFFISATTEHLFQPLLYQVATEYPNADVRLGRVVEVNAEENTVVYEASARRHTLGYRSLIAATGATQAYFGHDEFEKVTYKLKTVEDAEVLRKQILRCFEEAHTTNDALVRPTGVELAGQIKELARRYFAKAINNISADEVTVTMVEGAGVALPAFGGKLILNTMVTAIDEHGVTVSSAKTKEEKRIDAETVIWSSAHQSDLTVGGFANVFAIGDMTSLNGLPGQSPVAMQGGRHAAKTVNGKVKAGTPFQVLRQGQHVDHQPIQRCMSRPQGRVQGTIAWFMWLAVHVMYLVGFRNRYVAVMSWFGSFIGHRRPHFHYAQEPMKIEAAPPVTEREPELAHSA
ncbi:unnamed protein product, partial [Mesorhabditis spiculigera]